MGTASLHESDQAMERAKPEKLQATARKLRLRLTELEWELLEKLRRASMVAGSSHKRFVRQFGPRETARITPGGRWYLAFLGWRYRKQYAVTAQELDYIKQYDGYMKTRYQRGAFAGE